MRLSKYESSLVQCSVPSLKVKKARTDKDMAVDLKHLESLIDGNTVAIVGL